MAELSDYQISQITENIKRFNETYKSLINKKNKNNIDRQVDKAASNLKNYLNDSNQAIQDAEKAFKRAIEGEHSLFNLLSTNGLNDVINKKFKESDETINKIIKQNNDEINSILNAIPSIGKALIETNIFDSSEYAGDMDYYKNSIFDRVAESLGSSSTIVNLAFDYDENNIGNDNDEWKSVDISSNHLKHTNDFEIQGPTLLKCNSNQSILKIDDNISIFNVGCFQDLSSLTRIEFEKVSEFKMNLFSGCTSLKIIVLPNNIDIISPHAFRNIPDDCIICFRLPEAKVRTYKAVNGKKVIFDYKDGDENKNDRIVIIEEEKIIEQKPKRTVIKKDTPLDSDETIILWISRNPKYEFDLQTVKRAIAIINDNVDKDAIIKESLSIKADADLNSKKFFHFAKDLNYLLKMQKNDNEINKCLESIFGLMYLDTSGYRMYDEKYSPYCDYEHNCGYHPSMELKDLNDLIEEGKIGNDSSLDSIYRNSKYVVRLTQLLEKPLYSVDSSIKLMHLALQNPYEYFNPHTSGVIKNYK